MSDTAADAPSQDLIARQQRSDAANAPVTEFLDDGRRGREWDEAERDQGWRLMRERADAAHDLHTHPTSSRQAPTGSAASMPCEPQPGTLLTPPSSGITARVRNDASQLGSPMPGR